MANSTLSEENAQIKICDTFNYELPMIQSFPSKGYVTGYCVVFVVNILLSFSTIFLNLLTIMTFRSSNHLQKKLCLYLIYVQSWNDLGIGFIVSPLHSILVASELLGSPNCDIYVMFRNTFVTTGAFSVVILSAMNFERYLSIVHPIYHRNKVTKKKLLVYIFSLCALFVCMSFASSVLGDDVFTEIAALVGLSYFISTLYIYVNIFLVGKAKLKTSVPSIGAPRRASQIGRNDKVIRLKNYPGHLAGTDRIPASSSDNQRTMLANQGGTSSDDSQAIQLDNGGPNSHTEGDNKNRISGAHQGTAQSDHQDHQDSPSDSSDNRFNELNNQDNPTDNRCNQSNKERRQSYSQDESGDQGYGSNVHENQLNIDNTEQSNKTSSNKRSEQEILMKLKLAKSCFIVVLFSFISYVIPASFIPLDLDEFDRIVVDGWCSILVISNSTVDCLIFFWKNKILRNEAKKVFKKIWT